MRNLELSNLILAPGFLEFRFMFSISFTIELGFNYDIEK